MRAQVRLDRSGPGGSRRSLGVLLVVLLLLIAVPALALCPASTGSPTNIMDNIAQQLSRNCWSCQLYSSVYYGMRSLVTTTYATLVGSDLGGPALGITIVAVTLLVRFIPFLVGTQDSVETIAGLRMFFFRISIVFIVFLTTGSASVMGPNGIASNFYVDGPLALGTAVAESLSSVTSAALATSTGQPNNSLFGTYGSVPGGSGSTVDMGGFAQEHVRAAQTILGNLHQMGVAGMLTGLWLGLEDPNVSILTPGLAIVCLSASLFMTWTFFIFTLTFGLKYIDALIRAMLIFSLAPFFIFLWIFDSTRSMAVQALKSGLALAGVFAVSGIVFTMAYYILALGYSTVFKDAGGQFPGLQTVLCDLNSVVIANTIGSAGQGGSLNWMSYFYLIGSASMATACASLAFDLAGQIFDFGSAELGVSGMVTRDLQSGMSGVMGAIKRAGS